MRSVFAIVWMCLLAGCGPMVAPMFARPNEEQQARIDGAWSHMLAHNGNAVSRQALLDVLTCYQLYETGVDRAMFRSEKMVDGKLVVMEVQYDMTHPKYDLFTVCIYDESGALVREEHFQREEVEDVLGTKGAPPATQPGEPATPAQIAYQQEYERRKRAVVDATGLSEPPMMHACDDSKR